MPRFHPLTVSGSALALFMLAGCGNGTVIGSGTPSPRPSVKPSVTYEYAVPTAASGPFGIVTGTDSFLYFTEQAGSKIGQLTTGGSFKELATTTASAGPAGIIVGPDNHLWFAESSAGKIGTFATFLASSLTEHAVPWAGSTPLMLARGGPFGSIYFTDPGANAIGRINTDGTFAGPYAIPTAGAGAYAIATDQFGNEWFTESNASKVGVLNTATNVITEYALSANAHPADIVFATDGAVWFAENIAGGAKLGRITSNGAYTEYALTGAQSAVGLMQDGFGDFVVTDPSANAIGIYKAFGSGSFAEYPIPTANAGALQIAYGPDGKLYFTENTAGKIGQFTYF